MRLLSLFAIAALLATGCSKPPPATTSEAGQMAKDAMLAGMVRAQIATVGVDSALRAGIQVSNGNVKLVGKVPSQADRDRVVTATKAVSGVKSVDDQLRVDPSQKDFSGGDFALAARVSASLAAQTGINAVNLRVNSKDGTITLHGKVASEAIKTTALATARKTSGVKGVVDKITVGS